MAGDVNDVPARWLGECGCGQVVVVVGCAADDTCVADLAAVVVGVGVLVDVVEGVVVGVAVVVDVDSEVGVVVVESGVGALVVVDVCAVLVAGVWWDVVCVVVCVDVVGVAVGVVEVEVVVDGGVVDVEGQCRRRWAGDDVVEAVGLGRGGRCDEVGGCNGLPLCGVVVVVVAVDCVWRPKAVVVVVVAGCRCGVW